MYWYTNNPYKPNSYIQWTSLGALLSIVYINMINNFSNPDNPYFIIGPLALDLSQRKGGETTGLVTLITLITLIIIYIYIYVYVFRNISVICHLSFIMYMYVCMYQG